MKHTESAKLTFFVSKETGSHSKLVKCVSFAHGGLCGQVHKNLQYANALRFPK